jgi:hypothetical protein
MHKLFAHTWMDYFGDDDASADARRTELAEAVIDRFDQFVRSTGTAHATAAEAIRADPACFELFVQRKWPADWLTIATSLDDWLAETMEELDREARMPVMTPAIVNVLGMVEMLREDGGIGLVMGDSGLGKSESVRAVLLRNQRSISFEAVEARMKMKAVLEDIGTRLHRSYFTRETADAFNMVCQNLPGSTDLLVVDQAHAFVGYPKVLGMMMDILTHTKVPQLWFATGDLERYLDNKVGSWRDPFAQIRSRITHRLNLNVIRDTGNSINDAGIRELAKRKFDLRLDAGAVAELQAVATLDNEGSLRLVETILKHVRRLATDSKLSMIERRHIRASMDRTLTKRTKQRLNELRAGETPEPSQAGTPATAKRSKVG